MYLFCVFVLLCLKWGALLYEILFELRRLLARHALRCSDSSGCGVCYNEIGPVRGAVDAQRSECSVLRTGI